MRILITGITGFVGGHLTEHLLGEPGHTIFGISRHSVWPSNLSHLDGKAELQATDLTDGAACEQLVRTVRPDWVFHLAGYANTGKSFREPDLCWRDNLTATRSLYDAIARTDVRPRIVFVSTGLVYGDSEVSDHAVEESAILKPASPYAASKAAADLLSYQYTRSHGLDIIRVRLFNQIGPRQSAEYAVANFARQIANIELGKQPAVLETGDISSHRDLTDIRDIVTAFRLLMDHGKTGEVYNAGRGKTWQIQDILNQLLRMASVTVEVRQTIEPGRRADTTITRANPTKLRTTTGWQPVYPIEQTLKNVLDYWRTEAIKT